MVLGIRLVADSKTTFVTVNLNVRADLTYQQGYSKTTFVTVNLSLMNFINSFSWYSKTTFVTVNHIKNICLSSNYTIWNK